MGNEVFEAVKHGGRAAKISNPMTSLRRACAANIFEMTVGTGPDVIGVSASMNASSEQFSNLPS
jgi:hypothetical protein